MLAPRALPRAAACARGCCSPACRCSSSPPRWARGCGCSTSSRRRVHRRARYVSRSSRGRVCAASLRGSSRAGACELPAHASPAQILALFEEGKVILEQVTVVEGATFADFLDALEQHPRVVHTLRGKSPPEIMAALGHPGLSPEGEFFPDTYRFAANTTDAAILA